MADLVRIHNSGDKPLRIGFNSQLTVINPDQNPALCLDCGSQRDAPHLRNKSRSARCKSCRYAYDHGFRTRKKTWGYLKPERAPTISPTNLDIAWAAGVYEGEGSTRGRGLAVEAIVPQLDRWLCDQLRELFGGRVTIRNRNGAGNNNLWVWVLYGPRARGFLLTIYSFLSPRRQQQIRTAMNLREAA